MNYFKALLNKLNEELQGKLNGIKGDRSYFGPCKCAVIIQEKTTKGVVLT